jgi:hypothetical protein
MPCREVDWYLTAVACRPGPDITGSVAQVCKGLVSGFPAAAGLGGRDDVGNSPASQGHWRAVASGRIITERGL